jgi:hypothetical protein
MKFKDRITDAVFLIILNFAVVFFKFTEAFFEFSEALFSNLQKSFSILQKVSKLEIVKIHLAMFYYMNCELMSASVNFYSCK